MKKINLIAADIGAGSGRIFLSSYDGNKIRSDQVYRFSNGPMLLGSTLYWDILKIMDELGKGLKKACQAAGEKVKSIGIDSWGADFGLLDNGGHLISNPVSYRDKSIFIAEEEMKKLMPPEELNELNSSLTYNHCTLNQLYYLYKYRKDLAGAVCKYLPIADLISYFITGVKAVDISMLSGSQLFNVSKRKLITSHLDELGINKEIIPQVMNAGTVLGTIKSGYAEAAGIDPGIKMSLVCGHDTASAVTGIPFSGQDYPCFINSGTWSVMGIESADAVTDKKAYKNNFTNWNGYKDRILFLKIFNGFYFIQECKKIWDSRGGSSSNYDDLYSGISENNTAASLIDLEDRSLLLPGGTMTEKIDVYLKDTGQKPGLSMDEVLASLMHSIILEYMLVLDQLKSYSAKEIDKIYMVGGGSLNHVFCQWTTDCLGADIYTGFPESTISGNAIVQLIALGEIKTIEEGRKIIKNSYKERVYSPRESQSEKWEILKTIYKKLKKI
jgi:sugar (pentulose or hexulose) kinase